MGFKLLRKFGTRENSYFAMPQYLLVLWQHNPNRQAGTPALVSTFRGGLILDRWEQPEAAFGRLGTEWKWLQYWWRAEVDDGQTRGSEPSLGQEGGSVRRGGGSDTYVRSKPHFSCTQNIGRPYLLQHAAPLLLIYSFWQSESRHTPDRLLLSSAQHLSWSFQP